MLRNLDFHQFRRLVGESLREVGILVGVFGPLDAGFQYGALGGQIAIATMVVGILIGTLGLLIEATREG